MALVPPADLASDPHPGVIVPVVTVALFDGKKRVLLLKRKKPPYSGYWELVGGRLEFGERLGSAAARELLEETGVSVPQEELLFISQFQFLLPSYHRLLFSFAAQVGSPKIKLSEHNESKWFEVSKLPEPLIPFVRDEILLGYRALFG